MFRKCISSVLIIQFLHPKVTPFVSKISLPLHHGINDNRVEGPLYVSVIREFTCLRCGKHVRVTDDRDCRTKFCSQHCEKLYWKHSQKVSSVVMHREFTCRECGKVVVVTEPKDRRRSFCSDECRKRWFNQRRSVSYKPR